MAGRQLRRGLDLEHIFSRHDADASGTIVRSDFVQVTCNNPVPCVMVGMEVMCLLHHFEGPFGHRCMLPIEAVLLMPRWHDAEASGTRVRADFVLV